MGPIITRAQLLRSYVAELWGHGLPEITGDVTREALFIVDGVGGFQAAPLMIRRALRHTDSTLGTILYRWQFGLPGEIWTDLMWHRRNKFKGRQFARQILAFHRAHPQATIHLFACSGGVGVSLFALEAIYRCRTRGHKEPACERSLPIVETLILACPAVSPEYNLMPALGVVRRCYALVSHRDSIILGLGTQLFGTMDRRFTKSAGMVGFRVPPGLTDEGAIAYDRLREIRWSPELKKEGHGGGHSGSISLLFLKKNLIPLLDGTPKLPTQPVRQE